jgi:hypothetical protein
MKPRQIMISINMDRVILEKCFILTYFLLSSFFTPLLFALKMHYMVICCKLLVKKRKQSVKNL